MLQSYLENSIISLKEDDGFVKLGKAVGSIKKKLVSKPYLIKDYTLVALDENVDVENDVYIEVKKQITTHWKTFLSNASDTPVTFIRAVIWSALEGVSDNFDNALTIYLTAKYSLSHYGLSKTEEGVLTLFLKGLGQRIEEEATSSWSLDLAIYNKSIPDLKRYEISKLDKSILAKKVGNAAGPFDESTVYNENPFSINGEWIKKFGELLAGSILEAVDKSTNSLRDTLTTKVNLAIDAINVKYLEGNKYQNIKNELIWWKESGYSRFLNNGYVNLSIPQTIFTIAYDAAALVPRLAPESLHYFLKTVLLKYKNDSSLISAEKILEELNKFDEFKNSLTLVPKNSKVRDRQSIYGFIEQMLNKEKDLNDFEKTTGLSKDIELSAEDWLLWLFSDIQSFQE